MFQQLKTVLVVADHPRLRASIRKILQRMGLSALECSDGAAARELLSSASPDLVLFDLVLPESSGFELCEFIRQSPRHAGVPLVAMSERSHPADRAHAFEVGADEFLEKPFHELKLRELLQGWLDRSAPAPLRQAAGP